MENRGEMTINSTRFSRENVIDYGTRSVCYREGDRIFKVVSGFAQKSDALRTADELKDSRDVLQHWLGGYVVPSEIEVTENIDGFEVVTEQSFVDGVSLKKAVEMARRDNLNMEKIVEFLEKSLNMYSATDQLPDIFGRPHVLGWYQVLSTPNVRVELKDGVLFPRLLDVGFARLSQNKITKTLHNNLLAKNISVAIEKIRRG